MYNCMLALEMASPGNQHCANCIGTLSFPIGCRLFVSRRRRFLLQTMSGSSSNKPLLIEPRSSALNMTLPAHLLLSAGACIRCRSTAGTRHSAANQPHAAAAVDRRDRQTGEHPTYRHTVHVTSVLDHYDGKRKCADTVGTVLCRAGHFQC